MATTNLISKSVGKILIQSGVGTPNHDAPDGSEYVDLDTVLKYYRTDGIWYETPRCPKPYVSTAADFKVFPGVTKTIEILGESFNDGTSINLGTGFVINSKTITPTKITLDITASGTDTPPFTIEIKNCGIEHFGEFPTIEVTSIIEGTGPAGTFTTTFDGGNTGQTAWGSEWDLAIFGNINSLDGYFVTTTAGTPSSGTGPTDNTVFPAGSNEYLFTEASNPNNGAGQYATAETSNFKVLTDIYFDLHMYGSGIGDLEVQILNENDVWTQVYLQSGQLQAGQSSAAQNIHIDTSAMHVSKIKFIFNENNTSYAADIAIDNVELIST